MVDWTQVLMAAVVGLPATIAAVGAIILGIMNAWKIDKNTKITKEGAESATTNAQAAADAATSAKESTDAISRKLNGGIDAAIKEGVQPVLDTLQSHVEALQAHIAEDKKVAEEIKGKFDELSEYVHQRNHDQLDALSVVSNKVEIVMRKIGADK